MSLTDLIASQFSGDAVKKLSQTLGANEQATQAGISNSLPMILGALSRNARNEEGASSLAGALERDHDGSILDNLGGFLQSEDDGGGSGILKHVLGNKQPVVQQAVAKESGLDVNTAGKLLANLAPVIMGVLGKQKKENGLDVGGLSSMLKQEQQQHEASPSVNTNMISGLLDRDGDGDIMDDIGGMLGGLFGKK